MSSETGMKRLLAELQNQEAIQTERVANVFRVVDRAHYCRTDSGFSPYINAP